MTSIRPALTKFKSLLLVLVIASAQVATATGPFIQTARAAGDDDRDKIRICHSTQPNPSQGGGAGPQNNPYTNPEVSTSAADGVAGNENGHGDHYGEHNGPLFVPGTNQNYWGDIIPPIPGVHDGLNWTTAGQAIWRNGCTFAQGNIAVEKRVDNDGSGDFELGTSDSIAEKDSVNGLGFRWSYTTDTPALLMGTDEDNLPVGEYSVTENSVPGYEFVSWYVSEASGKSCANPSGTTLPVPVAVIEDTASSVTFCNRRIVKNASITITKVAVPNDEQDFLFTTTGEGLNDFSLDNDGNATLSDTKLFTGLGAGAYSVSEAETDGWGLTGVNCGQASGVSINGATTTINLTTGQHVSCIYTNTRKTGSIQVIKYVDEGEGYVIAGDESEFKWGLDGGGVNRDMGTTQASLTLGDHAVTENSVMGYELAGWYIGKGSCSDQENKQAVPVTASVLPDQTTTVTFCNKAEEDTKITLCHATGSENNPFGSITVSPAGAYGGHLGEDHQNGEDIIPPFQYNDQTYSQNWDAVGQAIIRNGCKMPADSKVSGYKFHDINGDGQKNSVWEPNIGGWTVDLYKAGGQTPIATTTTSNSQATYGYYEFKNLPAGDYIVCEAHVAGWKQIVPNPTTLNEQGCHAVTLTGIDSKTDVIFGNQARATIKVYKNVDKNGDGDTKDYHETNNRFWTWNYSSVLDSDSNRTTGRAAQSVRTGTRGTFYVISENQKEDYDLIDVNCDQKFRRIGDSVKVFVTVGDEIECTFTNKKRAEVIIEKKADPEDGTDFHFTLSKENPNQDDSDHDEEWLPTSRGINRSWHHSDKKHFTLDDALNDDNDDYTNKETVRLKSGHTYYITEDSVEGWDLEKIKCYGAYSERIEGTNTLKLTIKDADDVYCWFKNEKHGKVEVTKYNDLDRNNRRDKGEPTLPGWEFTLGKETKCDHSHDDRAQASFGEDAWCDDGVSATTQITGEDGTTTFENVKPDKYQLTESMQTGWHAGTTVCNSLRDDEYDGGSDQRARNGDHYNDHAGVRVRPGKTVYCEVGNYQDVVLSLAKSNNRPDPTKVGDTVTYTLTASLDQESGALFNTTVTDLPPAGFIYVSGSWTSVSSLRGNLKTIGVTTEPTYGSPGTWMLADMMPGEVVTLTYQAKIASSVSDGTYPDIAYAQGCALPAVEGCSDEEVVLSNLHAVDTPFVNTAVTVGSPQVLAATVLVNTGAPLQLPYAIVAATLMLIGIATATRRNTKKGGAK